jgi:MYXO-CTERM domain-containing protein
MLVLISLMSLAQAQEAFSFVVVGDTQSGGSDWSVNWTEVPAIVEAANTHDPVLMLLAGDLVSGSSSMTDTVAQWEDFKLATADFDGTIYPVPGNHDVYGGDDTFAWWRATFDWLPTDDSPEGESGVSFYVDYGNTRFINITSDHPYNYFTASAEGLAWLDRVLSSSGGFEHIFVTTHHPVSFSNHNSFGGVAGDFWQMMVAYGVDGIFTGHWHRYQPSQLGGGGDTWETIVGTGGGWRGFEPYRAYQQIPGFLLVEVDGAEATATFYADLEGDLAYDDAVDSYTMAYAGVTPRGLRARYTFDEGSPGDSAPAELGGSVHGQLVGDAEILGVGVSGQGLVLDGGYVEAGAIGDYVLSINDNLTLSAWILPTAIVADELYGSAIIGYSTADYYTEDEETNYSYLLSIRDGGTLVGFWEYGDGSNVSVASSEPADVLDGDWHHIAMVRDSSELRVRFYVDGIELGSPQAFTELPTGGGRGMLYLGADNPAYPGYELGGYLDEICIYDLALTGSEVGRLAGLENCESVTDDIEEPTDTGDGGDTGQSDSGGSPDTAAQIGDTAVVPGEDLPAGRDTAGGEDGEDGEAKAKGCGCAAGAPAGGGLWLVGLGLGWLRRRRVGTRPTPTPA